MLSRLAILSLAAAALVGLTQVYGGFARPPLPSPSWQYERLHHSFGPNIILLPECLGDLTVIAIYAVAGRLLLRLRLSSVPPKEGKPILLHLRR